MWIILGGVLLVSVVFDIKSRVIPNRILLPGIIAAFILTYANNGIGGIMDSAIAFLTAFGVLWIPFAFNWLGGGDVKLIMVVGVLVGKSLILRVIFFTVVIGAIYGLFDIIRRGHLKRTYTRFRLGVIELASGYDVCKEDENGTDELERGIPYAVPIALGTILALLV